MERGTYGPDGVILEQITYNYSYNFIADQSLTKTLQATKWNGHNFGNIFLI